MNPKVYVLLLNWNGWVHTLECLESLFRNEYPHWQVVVCDNASTDNSMFHIKKWADGEMLAPVGANPEMASFTTPPCSKPVVYCQYTQDDIENSNITQDSTPLILIQNKTNLGYAGGCNVGLKYILKQHNAAYAWLLNNDTVIEPGALTSLVNKSLNDAHYGICGSTLVYYHQPKHIQARGGNQYFPALGSTSHIGFNEFFSRISAEEELKLEKKMAAPVGASMLVSRSFLENVGLMSEDYFLYFEELDWALRGRGRYHLGYASDSIIYHKEGASIGGGNKDKRQKSELADYYEIKNRLLISRKFYPMFIPTVLAGYLITIINRLRRKQVNRIPLIFQAIRDGLQQKINCVIHQQFPKT
ncbi:MAG: glycosyltransferase family 2 protein [SAR324 cluster bacterium]|nr:glycosyltransferase family 2 protein [SAR324 cluster bacterium]